MDCFIWKMVCLRLKAAANADWLKTVLESTRGETTISRQPTKKRFRYLLFEVAMSLVAKLIRAFYAMLAKGVNYNPKKMMGDSERPAVYL